MALLNLLLAPLKWLWGLIAKPKPAARGDGATAPSGPEPVRVALLGHSSTGKTVFYGMLYRALQNDPTLQVVATSGDTEEYLQQVINLLLGREVYEDEMRQKKTRQIDPKFPPGTADWRAMHFNVRTRGIQFPLELREYAGEFLQLQSLEYLDPDIKDFLDKASCVFFMIDPEKLDSEVEMEGRIGSLNILLHRIAGSRQRANLPLALLISKADILGGFNRDDQSILIPPSVLVTHRTTFERLKEAILKSAAVQRDPVWAQSVTKVLDGCSSLLRVALHHADGFQIFFLSSVGKPEKRIDEFGHPRPVPSKQIKSVGLREPFRWWSDQMLLHRGERRAARFAKTAAVLSLIFIVLGAAWHLPHRWNYWDARSRWSSPASDCDVATRYFQGFVPFWFHAVFNSRVALKLGWDLKQRRCEENCAVIAATELKRLDCRPELLLNCDDVLTRCYNPVQARLQPKGLTPPPPVGVAAPPTADAKSGADVKLESQYQKCGPEIRSEMFNRIRQSQAGRDSTELKRALEMGMGQIPALYGSDDELSHTLAALNRIVACAGDDKDNLTRMLNNATAASRVFRLREILLGGSSTPAALPACNPTASLMAAKTLRTDFQDQSVYPLLAGWLEARSFYCLRNTSCLNLGRAPEPAVQACVSSIKSYLEANPPLKQNDEAVQLQSAAYTRLEEIKREALAQGSPGAGGIPGAAVNASATGAAIPAAGAQPPVPGGTPPPPPPSPDAATKLTKASQNWQSLRLVLMAKKPPSAADLFYFRLGDAEWSHDYISDPNESICVPRGTVLGIAFGFLTDSTVNPRSPLALAWPEMTKKLIEQGRPAQPGEPDAADNVALDFGNGQVTATFRLEGQIHGCP